VNEVGEVEGSAMNGRSEGVEPAAKGPRLFTTTHGSVVLAAGHSNNLRATDALERLCRTYWEPIYAYLRRQGHDVVAAQDLTQGFFAHLLERGFPKGLTPAKGKFRPFLLTALQHFLADEWDKRRAEKRGGCARRRPGRSPLLPGTGRSPGRGATLRASVGHHLAGSRAGPAAG
jgi:hypothetical protein